MLLLFCCIRFRQDVGGCARDGVPGAVLADTRAAGTASPGQDPNRVLKSVPVAQREVPDVFQQPPLLPWLWQAASGSPFTRRLSQPRFLQLHIFLTLVLLPFLLQAWICWEEQLLPGAPGRPVGWAAASKHWGLSAAE